MGFPTTLLKKESGLTNINLSLSNGVVGKGWKVCKTKIIAPFPILCCCLPRADAYTKYTTDEEHAEAPRLAKEEKAIEAAISNAQKKLKEATAAAAAGS